MTKISWTGKIAKFGNRKHIEIPKNLLDEIKEKGLDDASCIIEVTKIDIN